MDAELLWALKAGFFIGGPLCLIAGTFFAISTSISILHHPLPRLLGWVFGMAFATVTGTLLRHVLAPFLWPWLGMTWCSGYGWAVAWTVIAILGRVSDKPPSPSKRVPLFPEISKPKPSVPDSPASPIRIRRNPFDGGRK